MMLAWFVLKELTVDVSTCIQICCLLKSFDSFHMGKLLNWLHFLLLKLLLYISCSLSAAAGCNEFVAQQVIMVTSQSFRNWFMILFECEIECWPFSCLFRGKKSNSLEGRVSLVITYQNCK